MSIYSYLCCTDCKVSLWLGKAMFRTATKIGEEPFQIGPEGSVPNSENKLLVKALLMMLAKHHGHSLRMLFDYEYDSLADRDSYCEIGGDCEGDLSLKEYINDG